MSPLVLRNLSTWKNRVSPLSISRPVARLRLLTPVLAIVITASSVIAQTAEFTQNSPSANTMTLQVPLRAYPGRGASLPVSLYYSSKVWRLGFIKSIYSSYGLPRSAAEAIYAEHSTAGWTSSLDVPKVEWPKQNDVYWYTGKSYARGTVQPFTFRVARVFIHMPDGSTHELRKSDQAYQDTGSIDMVGTFWAVDGSRMRYDSYSQTTGTLFLADGTRYVINASTTQYIDRNGNTLDYNGGTRQWTDTLGRVIGQPLPTVPVVEDRPYVVPGLGGSITYIFKWRKLSTVLTQGQSLKTAGDYYLPNPALPPTDYNGNNFPQATTGVPSLFQSGYSDDLVESSFTYIVGQGQVGNTPFDPVVLAEIVLPIGQPNPLSYKFGYNINGEIDKATFPTGAYQRYLHEQVAPLTYTAVPYDQGSRGVTSRWVSPNGTGGSDESQWQHQATFSYQGYKVSVTDPNGTRTESYLHNNAAAQNTSFGHQDPRIGQPYEERVYAPVSQGGAMLRRSLTEYAWSSATFSRPSPGSGTYTANRNPRPIKNVGLILDTGGSALTSAATSQYDTTYQFTVGPDRTQSAEYAYTTVDQTTAQDGAISAIPLGALVRSSETTFLTSNDNYRNRNILGLVSWSAVKNAAGATVSQASFNYDESSYPLLTYGPVTGWTDPQTTYRGNVTTASRWLDYPASTWIATHAQYDQCGSVRHSWDAKGNFSQTEYSNTYAYAYPTQTTSAVPDPSGMYGQTTSLVTTAAYDLNTGLVTSATDANAKTTSFEYNDPLNRIRKVNNPDGGWTITNYSDTMGNTSVHTQTLQQTSPTQKTLDSYQFFDKAGRGVRSFAKEGATYLTSDTQYDNLGRVSRVSNPYRTTALTDPVNPSNTWTTNAYDSLSRVKTVTMPDGAQVITDYSAVATGSHIGTSVMVTDPALRKRKSISNAQGRVIQVIEDPTNLAYQTNYTYDVLNNLRKVEQGSQLRYFGYDSLSRVIRVRNIEQTVNTALNWYDPVTTYNGGWTRAMSYDNNGNVVTRVDARNVTTTYGYDALNRNTTVRYTDGTKDIDRHYDGAINGKGRFYYSNWDQYNNTRFDSHVAIDEYDAMGRAKNYRQHFLTNAVASPQFNVKRTYNLAGQPLTQTYPSGHTVSYAYDGAGRINNYSGNLGDGVSRTYSTGISYSEFGGLQQEQFGTQTPLYQKLHYNVRGQLYDTRLSTLSIQQNEFDWNRGCLASYFGGYAWGQSGPLNNGNVTMQQHWAPANDSYTDYAYTQDAYSYDTLNRLASTNEVHGGPWGVSGQDYIQTYDYDRFGNRTINQGQTSTNVPRPNYTVDQNTNRLIAPAGYNFGYDAAGNQTNDNYTGQGQRTYDAENHLKQAWANGQWQTYTYDADGRRIKRNVNGAETWQVYGMGGELLAEYKSGSAAFLPSKEYGYRGGQLLVTMSSGDDVRLARFVTNLYYGALQRDPNAQELQDGVNQLAAAGAQSQSQLLTVASQIARSLFTSTNYELSPYRSDAQYVADLYLAYLQRGPDDGGLGWWTGQVPGSGRANVCNAFEGSSEFATLVATLYGTATSDNERTDHFVNSFYLGAYGRNATSTELQQQRDALNAAAAQGLNQVQAEAESFGRSLFAAQVNDAGISNTQFVTNLYEAFLQRGPDAGGLGWWSGQASVGSGRQNVLNAFATCGPFDELAGTLYREAFWLVSDRLGTPRMIVDRSGSLASVKRHDYLPFGEEIGGPLVGLLGGRTTTQGYTVDSVRQKFTGYEADAETGLNFAQARYQSSVQGRFTSVDPLGASASVDDPQTFNRYSYVNNDPLNQVDPDGLMGALPDATTAWGDVADGFWGTSFHYGAPRAQNHIGEAMARDESILETGYDPAFDVYRGEVEVQHIFDGGGGYMQTLHNPTPAQLNQTMENMISDMDLVAQKQGRPTGRGRGNGTGKPTWVVVPDGRGKTKYVYRPGGATWGNSTGRPPSGPGRVPGVEYNKHHLFPQQFRVRFEKFGINIDRTTILMPAPLHRKLHPQWNRDWANFFQNNPRAEPRDVYRFAVDMMFRHNLHNYPLVPYRR
ncbi:MAG: DUF4214 domain-containing protein [Pyrinomonadaceae bacterium]|nr:DUF4214 domain-containing protein [Pyrinomonadaceae bacterium]